MNTPLPLFAIASLSLVVACGGGRKPVCACPAGVQGFATYAADSCLCLPSLPATPDPDAAQTFHVDPDVAEGGDGSAERPWTQIDWPAVDASLVEGHVLVLFSSLSESGVEPQLYPDRVDVFRTNNGPFRVVLDGRSMWNTDDDRPTWRENDGQRAQVPGVGTGYEDVARHRVTVRGFEITRSKDKGVYWRAGDEILIEDCVVHDNKGSPSINLEYVSRTGMPSSSFVVRNNHVYDQVGECIYIGGAEGEDLDAHEFVVVENNLVHDCRDPFDTKHDGINIKDRIGEAIVRQNVVLRVDWGVEAGSPGTYSNNLVVDANREAYVVNVVFAATRDMVFLDNVAVRPGHDGWHLNTSENPATGMRIERFTSIDAGKAGLLLGVGQRAEIAIDDVLLIGGRVGLDGWGDGPLDLDMGACAVAGNEVDQARLLDGAASCDEVDGADLSGGVAGPDGLVFTLDDPWWTPGRGAQLPQ